MLVAHYLGYLVAREAGKRFSIQELAKLDCAASREVALAAMERLLKNEAAR